MQILRFKKRDYIILEFGVSPNSIKGVFRITNIGNLVDTKSRYLKGYNRPYFNLKTIGIIHSSGKFESTNSLHRRMLFYCSPNFLTTHNAKKISFEEIKLLVI